MDTSVNAIAREKIVVLTCDRIEESDGQTPFMHEETISQDTLLLIITDPELRKEFCCLRPKRWNRVWKLSHPRLRSRPRSRSTPKPSLDHEKKFVPIKQFTKRPTPSLSNPVQCLKRFGMINEKVSTDGRDNTAGVIRFEKIATKHSFSDIFGG